MLLSSEDNCWTCWTVSSWDMMGVSQWNIWRFFAVCPQTFMAMIVWWYKQTWFLLSSAEPFVCNWECLTSWYMLLSAGQNQPAPVGGKQKEPCVYVSHTVTAHCACLWVWVWGCSHISACSLCFVTGLVCREFVFQCLNHAGAQAKDRWLSNMSTAVLLHYHFDLQISLLTLKERSEVECQVIFDIFNVSFCAVC